MAMQENTQVVREVFAAWNAHDADRLGGLLGEEFESKSDAWPAPIRGREAQRELMRMYVTAFPDLRFDIEQLLPSGDYVISRWHATGTHRGELMGIPPTNRRGEGIQGCTVAEVRNGKIVREWVYWDVATLLRQLEVMPPLTQAAAR